MTAIAVDGGRRRWSGGRDGGRGRRVEDLENRRGGGWLRVGGVEEVAGWSSNGAREEGRRCSGGGSSAGGRGGGG